MKHKQFLFTLAVMLSSFVMSVNAQVAKIGSTEYATLQAAMKACVAGDNTITLLEDNAEVFTFAQKSGVNITVDGDGNTFSGKITLSAGGGNLTFTDAKIAPANSQTIYLNASTAPNIVFYGCTLQGADMSGTIVYGYSSSTNNSITVKNCTADNLAYVVSHRQRGSKSVLVENVTATNMLYLIRTLKCPDVTVKNVTCDAVIPIQIRNEGGPGKLTLEEVSLNSSIEYQGSYYAPVQDHSGKGAAWTINLKGNNTFSKNGVAYTDNSWLFSGKEGYVIKDLNVAKIGDDLYYDFATAFDAAQPGQTIVLLADYTGDAITLAEGVKLDKNGFKADGITVIAPAYTVQIDDKGYATLAAAISAAKAGQTITFLTDIEENVTVGKAVTIDGDGKTYTSQMTLKADVTIKNVNFDGKGNYPKAYAIVTDKAGQVHVEGCTAKSYMGFLNFASNNDKATVKNVIVSEVGYGVKIDYSNGVTLENVNITATTAAVLNSNYGVKPITIKNSKLNILGTWTRNNTTKTNYLFDGANSIDKFIIDANIDNFKLAEGATLTAPNEITVTIDNDDYEVAYENGAYTVVEAGKFAVNGKKYKTLADALAAAEPGVTLEMFEDATIATTINGAGLTIDGKGHTLTYTGSGASARAITVESAANGANLTIKNLTINCTASYCQRGINYNTTGELVLDGVTVEGKNVTYALNLPGSSVGAQVTINNSSLTGNIALNVWGKNAEINATGSHFTSVDNSTAEGYSAIVLNNDGTTAAEGAEIKINGGSITATDENGNPSNAVRNSTTTGVINVSDATVVTGNDTRPVAIVTYGTDQFYSCATLQAAIDKAIATNGSVKLLANVEASDIITVNAPVVIDGNGKTVKSTAGRAFNIETEGKVVISNLTVNAGERAFNIINKPATVELNGVKATAKNNAVMIATSAGAAKVTIDGCDFTGLAVVNVAGEESNVAIKNSTITNVDANPAENYGAITVWTSAEKAVVNVENTTITVADDSEKAYVFPANATVTGVDEVGYIVATVGDAGYDTLEEAIKEVTAGGTIELVRNIKASEIITINKAVTINGNGVTLTSSAARAINIDANGVVTIKNLTVVASGERAFNVINKPATLNIENVTATAANYTVNVATSAGAAKVNISGSTLTGLNVVNVAAAGANVTINGGKITCNDQNTNESYAALALNKNAVNGKITAASDVVFEIKGDSKKASNGAEGGKITIGGVDANENVVAVIEYEGTDNYYSFETLAAAVAKAEAGETVKLLRDATGAGVVINKSITIDFNGKTYTVNAGVGSTGTETLGLQILKENNVILKNGTLTSEGENIKMLVQNYANLTVDNMKLVDATDYIQYVLSNNSGNVVIKNSSEITADGAIAFDACKYANYALPTVTVEEGVVVTGNVEVSATLNMNGTLDGTIVLDKTTGKVVTNKQYNIKTTVADYKVVNNGGVYTVVAINYVAKIGEQGYETLAAALAAANAGDEITLAADITEDVTVSKAVTINGADKTYTGAMTLKADAAFKNVNFDGKGYNGYAITTRGAQNLTIEDCTAKNYGYGFVQLASGTALTTVKNVTVSNMNYGVKVDYSNAVVLENVDMTAGVAAVLNSNYGEKTITIKGSKLNILGTWTRNNTIKTTYVFEGANTVSKFITDDAIDNFTLAAGATLTAPEGKNVTTVKGYKVEYADGKYISKFIPAGSVAYRADVTDKADREGIAILLKEVCATESLVVKVYNGETLMFTCTRRNIDDEGKVMFPVMAANTTANIVLWGKESGSWINEILVEPTELNVPNRVEIIADGVSVQNYTHESGTILGTNLEKYLALECVKKFDAKVGEEYHETLAGAVAAAQAGATVELLKDATGAGVVIDKNITIDFKGKTYTVNKTVGSTGTTTLGLQILKDNDVVLKNGTLKSTAVTEGKEVKMLVQNYANLTVENMNLVDETEHILYVLSNNSGNVVVKGNTNITTDKVAFDACKYANYAIPTVTVETTGKIAGNIEVTGGNLAIKGGTFTDDVTKWCAKGYVCEKNADGSFGVVARKVVKVGDKYYNSLRAAVEAAPAGATVTLLENVTLEGGYADDPDAGLRIEKAITIKGNGYTVDCGKFTKGIRVYNNSGAKSGVSFYNTTIVNNNAYGRCVDTRSGNIDLLLYTSTLKATGTSSQPLTLGGSERLYRVRIQATTIDAGKSGYGVIAFVPSWAGITASTGSNISGLAAFYLKDGVNGTTLSLDKGTYTGINKYNQNSGAFGTVVVEGDNNTIAVKASNAVVKAVSADGTESAGQAAFLVTDGATGNKIQITGEVRTEGSQTCLAMVDADVAASTSFTKNGVAMQYVAECSGYQFLALDEAFRFAENNSTIKLLNDVTLDTKNYVTDCDGYASIINVEGMELTFDLNGYTMTVDAAAADLIDAKSQMLLAVFSVDEGGKLTINDSSEAKTGSVIVNANDAAVYSVVTNYTKGAYTTINGGNFIADKVSDSMIYSGADNAVKVYGGTFNLANTGTGSNGKPWIFNGLGQNGTNIEVYGGTFNADVNHQYWAFEVEMPKTLAVKNNNDGTWTVVPAAASILEKYSTKYNRTVGYATIEEAIAALDKSKDGIVTMVADVTVENSIAIAADQEVVLDLNGKTITGTDNTSKNFGLFNNNGTLTIDGEGVIKLTATVNSGWGRYSAVISNNPGATLTVNGGTIEHRGGTDMAYGIDNLTNGNLGDVKCTINDGTIKSTYRAIRQFLNSDSKENNLTINGGVIEGANKSIFFHDPSTKANKGTLYVAEKAALSGDVYLFVTAGSTQWPVEVKIAKDALVDESEVLSANVPEAAAALVEYDEFWQVEQKNLAELTIVDEYYAEYINLVEKTVGKLTYVRTFETDKWQTIYLPFEVPVEALTAAGLQAAYIYNAAYKNGAAIIDHVVMTEGSLAANYPYMIRAFEAGTKKVVVENATLTVTDGDYDAVDCSSVFEQFTFTGTYNAVEAEDLVSSSMVKNFVLEDGVYSELEETGAFRFYLTIAKRQGEFPAAESLAIRTRSVDQDGNTSDIDAVGADQKVDFIFDLHGRRVLEPIKGGMYIINGKKVIF